MHGSKLNYKILLAQVLGKEMVYVLPITSTRIPPQGGCLWFGLEILGPGPSGSSFVAAAAWAPVATTTTSPALTAAEGLETAAQWAVCDLLLSIITYSAS